MASTSKIVSFVSTVAVAVRAINGIEGSNDLNSFSRANHTLKAACLLDFDLPLRKNKIFHIYNGVKIMNCCTSAPLYAALLILK